MEDQEPLHVEVGGGRKDPGRRLEVWARSIRGKVRQENQDAWCVATADGAWWGPMEPKRAGPGVRDGLLVAGVFDGLGGHANGREAAWAAARALPDAVAWDRPLEDVVARLQDAVVSAGGMTTALIAVVDLEAQNPDQGQEDLGDADQVQVRVLSVGDSAAFVRGGAEGLERVNELDRAGRHTLSDCLGLNGPQGEGPRGHEVRLSLGRGFVLTTDGMADEVPLQGEWGGLLGDPGARAGKRFHRLFEAVMERGAPDNATTILVRPSGGL